MEAAPFRESRNGEAACVPRSGFHVPSSNGPPPLPRARYGRGGRVFPRLKAGGGLRRWLAQGAGRAGADLLHFHTRRDLPGLQKSSHQLALAADGHAGKPLEPLAVRHFGLGEQPIGEKPKLIGGDVSAAHTVEQMVEQMRRKTVTADSRHGYSP